VKTILPIALILVLAACVPEPLEADCDVPEVPNDCAAAPDCVSTSDCPGTAADCPGTAADCPGAAADCPGAAPDCPDQGVCAAGLTAGCFEGEWRCPFWEIPTWEPVEVSCDGLDNDCDGGTDADLPVPAGTCKTQGVCAGAVAAQCAGADGWDCGYGQVAGYQEEETSFCDGLDNDCDGLTDGEEGDTCACVPDARACKPGDPGTAQVCPDDGSGWVDEPCPGGAECMGVGECTAVGVFLVNETVANEQTSAVATRTNTGQWVVSWESMNQDGYNKGIYTRGIGSDGELVGSEQQVNIHTYGEQLSPAIAPLADGRYLVAWDSAGQFGSNSSVLSRTWPEEGPSPYGEILVSADLDNDATGPGAATAGPAAVVVWEGGDAGDRDVLLRFVDAVSGQPLAAEVNLSGGGAAVQDVAPVVAPAGDGFVVLWEKGAPLTEIHGMTMGADGSSCPVIEVFSKPGDAAVAIKAAGTYESILVMWLEVGVGLVSGQVIDADLSSGLPLGSTTQLPSPANSVTTYAVAPDGWGGFVVAWQDDSADPPAIRLRRWDPEDGLASEADEVVVATSDDTPLSVTSHLSLAGGANGKIMVLWNGQALEGGSGSEVFARFIQIPQPD